MKTVEYVFAPYCNIYGEFYNMEYLKKSNDEIEIIKSSHKDEPYFVSNHVDMIYMGCMTEDKQEKAVGLLMPYKDRIKALIENGTIFLMTGNSVELFGQYISDDCRKIPALGIFDFYSERKMDKRHNSLFIGDFNDMKILGHKSQYSMAYGNFENPFMNLERGYGMNMDTKKEGIWYKNFYGTYSLGPFLVLNPYFTKYILRQLGLSEDLKFEKEIIEAYEYRLADFLNRVNY